METPLIASTHKKLQEAFTRALGLEAGVDVPAIEYGKHELWDSVAHMRLVSEIENAFDVLFENGDVLAMNSYRSTVSILTRLGISFDA